MFIESVALKDFRSHAETRIGFGSGINVILGENGAGKTSILEAISFALFKDYEGAIENLVRKGAQSMSVEVVFSSHGRKYKVERTRSKNASGASLMVHDGGWKLLMEGDSGIDGEIAGILGMDKYLFSNAVYVRQGELARLLMARPSEKKQLIGRLLGIEDLEKAWERMRAVVDSFEARKAAVEAGIAREDEIRERMKQAEKSMAELAGRLSGAREKEKDIAKRLEDAERGEKAAAGREKRRASAEAALGAAEELLERETEGRRSFERQASEAGEAARECAALAAKLPAGWREETGSRIESARKAAAGRGEEVGRLEGLIAGTRELGSKLEGAGDACPLCGARLTPAHREKLIDERESKIREAEGRIAEASREREEALAELRSLEKKREELTALDRRLGELRVVAGKAAEAGAALRKSEAAMRSLGLRMGQVRHELAEIGKEEKAAGTAASAAELRSEAEGMRVAIGKMQERLDGLSSGLADLRKEASGVAEKKKEHSRLAGFVAMLNEIRKAFDRSGIQRTLRLRSGPAIEGQMKEFFREFDFEYSDLSLDEDYGITLYGEGGEATTEMMSGGERIAAAIAMRLAIAKALTGGTAESLLLDEPTIFLDAQRRQDLIEVLRRLAVMPQLIVVTHDQAMEEAADRITIIRKERGVSSAADG